MWKIKHIFDGEYGCEETDTDAGPTVIVTLTDENDEERYEKVTDEWLTDRGLDVGDVWPD